MKENRLEKIMDIQCWLMDKKLSLKVWRIIAVIKVHTTSSKKRIGREETVGTDQF